MRLTLFEAIRQIHEGQEIPDVDYPGDEPYVRWECGKEPQFCTNCLMGNEDWAEKVNIIDLPKPKMTLDEGLIKAAQDCLVGKRFDYSTPTGYHWTVEGVEYPTWQEAIAAGFAIILREFDIDWQAEIDRKKEE